MRELKVGQAEVGQRADVFVAWKYPQFSRSSLDKLFDKGLVSVRKKPVKSSHKLKDRDVLVVDDDLLFAVPEPIELPILYEDDDILVIDKPAGVLTHSKGALNDESTIASFIRPKVSKQIVGNRAGIVHRLDRATSGVIITAKTTTALARLQKQFSTRKTKKTYMAVVTGQISPKAAVIDAPIARNPKKPQTFTVSKDGKSSQTEYKVIKMFTKKGRLYSLLEIKPLTGRTHQIRVHLKYIGHPVIGDSVYGIGGNNMMLHASQLEITLPSKQRVVFESALPKYFSEFIK